VTAQHSSATANWGTPVVGVELARAVLGRIDLDPCSNAYWNERTVKARRFYTGAPGSDGLVEPWSIDGVPGTAFVNPPGDKTGELVRSFWNRLVREWASGEVTAAIWIGFSLEQLVSLQKGTRCTPMDRGFHITIPSSRWAFLQQTEEGGRGVLASSQLSLLADPVVPSLDAPEPGESPSHGNFVTFLPPSEGREHERSLRAWESEIDRLGWARR
jgi:hypothetical protein